MISVIIPAFNEEKNLAETVQRVQAILHSHTMPFEMIVVDDGSRDGTYVLGQQLAEKIPMLRVFKHAVNQGPGAAFRTGFSASKGDYVVTMDCDLSYDPTHIPKLVALLKDYDVAIGAPFGPEARMENVPFLREMLSHLAYLLDRLFLGGGLPSYSSFFVAYRGDLIRSIPITCQGFDAQCEIYARILRRGARFAGLPCKLSWRDPNRKSSMKIPREGLRRLKLWVRFFRARRVIV